MRAAFDAGRLPHSLLLLSVPGLGAEGWRIGLPRWRCASRRASALRCLAPRADCCAPTRHPDVHAVRLEEDAQQIKIDQVRELIDSLTLKSYRGGYKVGVIEGCGGVECQRRQCLFEDLGGTCVTHDAHHDCASKPSLARNHCEPLPAPQPAAAVNRGGDCMARGELIGRSSNGARRWRWPAERRCWRCSWTPRACRPSMPTCARALPNCRTDRWTSRCLAERWVRSNPGVRITWLENWITQRVHAALGSCDFASNCGTGPLACRFT